MFRDVGIVGERLIISPSLPLRSNYVDVLISVFPIRFLSDFRMPNLPREVPYREYRKGNDGWWYYKVPVYNTGRERWIKCERDWNLTVDMFSKGNAWPDLQKDSAPSPEEK